MFKLTDGQRNGIRKAVEWYYNCEMPGHSKLFVLAGSAGTGKSTTASTAVRMMGLSPYQVLYATLSGKAASVLRTKGCVANTIHSVFYRVFQGSDGKTGFVKRKSIPSTIKLIVIDEFGMCNGKMCEDLLSFNIPILGLGDPSQLPPLFYPNPYITNPDVFLEEVMRQSGESGILKLATMARKEIPIDYGVYNESEVIRKCDIKNIEKYDAVIVWSNSARKELNMEIRTKLGYTTPYPVAGEKLMCLKNNYMYELDCGEGMILTPANGMTFQCLSDARESRSGDSLLIDYAPDYVKNQLFSTPVSKIAFDAYPTMRKYEGELMDIPPYQVVLDYSYALTCHKSQGSEYPNVLVIDDYHGPKDTHKNWLYTGLTRASERVTLAI